MATYAKIQPKSGLVVDLIVASVDDKFDPDFTWDDVTEVSPAVEVGFTYVSPGVYTSSVVPPTLAQAKAANLATATANMEQFVQARYSLSNQNALRNLYTLAVLNGLANRAAYCLRLMTWGQAAVTYAAQYIATVQAMVDVATVQATVPDYTALIAADPLVTPVGAIQIAN